MSERPTHIVTGGTGFVGSAIILELLQRTAGRILGITRPGPDGATARLHLALRQAAELYGHGDALDEAIAARVTGIPGDLHAERCGVEPRPDWAGAEFWHSAASLQFLERDAEAIHLTNVRGSEQVAALARAARVRTINVFSTAYVAGTRSGVINEAPAEVMDEGTNNYYERSKIATEQIFAAAFAGERLRILRPSIVIGHSRTRAALNYNGLYGFTRGVYKFRRLMDRTQRDLGSRFTLRMIADGAGTLNFIPVDLVAHDAVALALADAPPSYYHLTVTRPLPTRTVLKVIFESLAMRPPDFVDDARQFRWTDRKFNDRVEFYNAYFIGKKDFSRARIDAIVDDSPSARYALSEAELAALCRWYIEGPLAARKPPPETR
ncbi:MAG: SDR family oxidoreductase [Nannocystaceae bacterium]